MSMSERNEVTSRAAADPGATELRRYYWVIRGRIWIVIASFIVVTSLATLHAFKAKRTYEAVAEILIERQMPKVMTFQEVYQIQADSEYYRTQHQLIRSKAVLLKALQKPGVAELPELSPEAGTRRGSWLSKGVLRFKALFGMKAPPAPEPWERLGSWVAVDPVRDSHLVDVKVRGPHPVSVARMANAVAEAFLEFSLDRRVFASSEATGWLEKQMAKQKQELQQAEEALQQFREKEKLVYLEVDAETNPVLKRLAELDDQRTQAEIERIQLDSQVRAINTLLASGEVEALLSISAIRADPLVEELVKQNAEAHRHWQETRSSRGLRESAPEVVAARTKAELALKALQDAIRQAADNLSTQLAALSEREAELRTAYDKQNKEALELSRKSSDYQRLKSDVDSQRKLFDALLERLREVDLTGASETTNVSIVQEADVPKLAVAPKIPRTVALGAVLGLIVGVVLALFFDYLDDRIMNPEDIERHLKTTALGFVPDIRVDKAKAAMDGFTQRGMFSLIKPRSSVSEAYRSARTGIYFSSPPKSAKTILVTSVEPREGKTTTASNLALVMAQAGDRVLLVDADLRRPMVHDVFNLKNKSGLTEVLAGQASTEEMIIQPEYDGKKIDNLEVLLCGTMTENPAEVLGSARMRELVSALSQKYDRVIFDSPPVLIATDASILADICDGIVLVIKVASCRRGPAQRAKQQLESVNGRILGGLLNDVEPSKARYGYYGYSKYYSYGYSRYYKYYYRSARKEEKD